MKLWAKGLAIAAVGLAALAAGSSARAATATSPVLGPDGETAPVYSYANAIRERVFVPVPGVDQDGDGIADQMAIDIIRPQETSSGLKVPAIIDPSPYYTAVGHGLETEYIHTTAAGVLDKFPLFYDNFFVPRGYAYIAAEALGTGFSTGCALHGGPGDIAGFKAVIDWLMGRVPGYDKNGNLVQADWDNGKNAMIGKSYDGTLANGVAATGVDGLTTIVPLSAISDWYDYSRMGGIRFNTHYPASLSSAITQNVSTTLLGVAPPSRTALCLPSRNAMSASDGDSDGDVNQFWQDRNYDLNVDKVHAAVFESHGLNDDNVRPNHFSQWWAGLAANNVPRKLWLSQEGHIDPFDYRRATWVDTLHRWFDHWLQGVPNGIMSEPQVDIETGPNTWETQSSWPIPDTSTVDVYLRGAAAGVPGSLGLSSGGNTDSLTFTDANLSETNYLSLTGPQTSRLLFLSPPLIHDLRISGTPRVDIRASLSKPQTNLTAFLVDYGDGVLRVLRTSNDGVALTTTRSCWGDSTTTDSACYLEAVERTITPTVWRVSKGILDSSNRDSLLSGLATPATIGQTYEFTWPMLPNDFTFTAGHQIGIVIGADFTGFSSVNGTTGTAVTVDTRASKLILPVVGGSAAAEASGAFSSPDTVPPTLHLPSGITKEATGPTTPVTYSATATDDVDPSPTISCTPQSGSDFAVGTTTVDCTGSDASGNVATGSFNVIVTDTTAPALTSGVDASAEATGPGGATVPYALPTASDLVDGAVTPVCSPASGSAFPLGATVVHCTATDSRGNAAQTTLTVTVRDTTPPVLTVPASATADATSPSGVPVSWSTSASDVVDPHPTIVCTPAAGSFFPVGDSPVSCTATDANGNSTTKSFTVHVNGAATQMTNLRALVNSLGLDDGLATSFLGWLNRADKLLGRSKEACTQLDQFLAQAIHFAAGNAPRLTVAQAKALVAAANTLEQSLGCIGSSSPAPAAERDLLGLLGTIVGMNLAPPEETILTNQVRTAAKQVASHEGVCSSLDDLTERIVADAGKKNRLTAAQAAQLSGIVGRIADNVGCSGGPV